MTYWDTLGGGLKSCTWPWSRAAWEQLIDGIAEESFLAQIKDGLSRGVHYLPAFPCRSVEMLSGNRMGSVRKGAKA